MPGRGAANAADLRRRRDASMAPVQRRPVRVRAPCAA